MRSIRFAVLGLLCAGGLSTAARADIWVSTPGVIYMGGIQDLAASFTQKTGIKVTVKTTGVAAAADNALTANPAPDIVVVPIEPYDLMGNLAMKGGIVPGTFMPLGRAEFGLAVPKGATHPDISTPEKFVAALKSAKMVMRSKPGDPSQPGVGSMVGLVEDLLLKRPEFAGVNSKISTNGEGGQALGRGEGDMALQAVCEILPYPQIELVGLIPPEFYVHMDMAVAVPTRSTNQAQARQFIAYMMLPENRAVWKAHGTDRF